ncbi:glycerate kinase [Frigoribacterium sp. 2-23]|uniref:glycerate kinase n=1 Tax=Frigoribacterium sp. 2-23 TaxID=3415006 RepID=UPI003C70447B
MSRLRVVIAPDSFKGSASAVEVASALGRGWLRSRPDDDVVELPVADGGEGTVEAFARAVPAAVRHRVVAPGPDGHPVDADWLMLPDDTAVLELASASGLTLLSHPAPYDAHTRGLGRMIVDALDAGARRLLVGIGGSASTDGGLGVLTELGLRALDSLGDEVVAGSHGLSAIARLDMSGLRPLPAGGVTVLTDVTNPLLGAGGAAAVFGPQKGAGPDDVLALDSALARWAELLDVDPRAPGAGAAGGTGFGLLAWGADLAPGALAVSEAIGLPGQVARADVVIVGEGRYDEQTAGGKAPHLVASLARAAGARLLLVAGSVEAPTDGFDDVVSLTDLAGSADEARRRPGRWLEDAAAHLAGRVTGRA